MNPSWAERSRAGKAGIILALGAAAFVVFWLIDDLSTVTVKRTAQGVVATIEGVVQEEPKLDTADYDRRMRRLAHVPEPGATTTTSTPSRWPVTDAPYPLPGALLPFKRIVAYYGNFYSKAMGALGEYETPEMLSRLKAEAARWQAADPETPVVPAIHYIASTAQGAPGAEGLYMLRMPDSQVDHALDLARQVDGVVFLDLQVGLSTLQEELPLLDRYLALPQVHLGIDPEFAMYGGHAPGEVIGTMDAADVNFAIEHLAQIVRERNLPPKVLVVHRFTQGMLTNYQAIRPLPEVQVVIQMDGWGEPAKKVNTYATVITPEPVQFAGFKIFYKNDLRPPSTRLMTPAEVLALTPAPSYIQYQ